MEADLSQSEARIVACLSEDKFLLDNWLHGASDFDIHKWTAAQVRSRIEGRAVGIADVTKEQRQVNGKQPRHALNYGEGPNKFWRMVNANTDITGIAITLRQAKEIWAAYHGLHPNLDAVWWNRVERQLTSTGVVETCFGRVCRFYPRWDPYTERLDADTLRAAIAYEPQSTSVDVCNTGLLTLFAREDGFRVLHQGHDSVLCGVKRYRVQATAKRMKEALEREIVVNGHRLTIPVEVFVCPESWGMKERVL